MDREQPRRADQAIDDCAVNELGRLTEARYLPASRCSPRLVCCAYFNKTVLVALWVWLSVSWLAADPVAPPYQRTTLPQTHAYQQVLRNYLATLGEADFEHGVTQKFTTPEASTDRESQYRHWLLGRHIQPLIGTKRGAPAVNAPAKLFTLAAIETPQGVMRPPLWPEPVGFLVTWNYAGNPYYDSAAMKRRAFVTMCIHLLMVDDLLEHAPELGGNRTDRLAPQLILFAQAYPAVRDVVPEAVRAAYETGLRKMARRILDWGPSGEDPHQDSVAPIALWIVSRALTDPGLAEQAAVYARRQYSDAQSYHPAGFFYDHGGIDLGYAGQTNFFVAWTALATGWPEARDVLDRNYRLRAHLCLPEPDGKFLGPSHFNTRYSADATRDQWEWGEYRNTAAALVTDEALHLTRRPLDSELAEATALRARAFQGQINENPVHADRSRFIRNDEITSYPWSFRPWLSYNFPAMVNYAYEFYPKGFFARREKLAEVKSPLLLSPFQRDELFIRDFANVFTVAKQAEYSAVIHSGPVGGAELDHGRALLAGTYGFGGGQLSAFWTPATGSVILGRRGGTTRDKDFDPLENWRLWPIHAVSGARVDGKVFTSARIRQPEVKQEQRSGEATVRVTGTIPRGMLGQAKVLDGQIQYARTFSIGAQSCEVATTLQAAGQDTLAELVETIPVFLREAQTQAKSEPTRIEFQRGADWTAASDAWCENVSAIRLTRFTGAVRITFDRPRRVKLSAADWADTYLSRATCRNVLIDLLEQADQPQVFKAAATRYRIAPESK